MSRLHLVLVALAAVMACSMEAEPGVEESIGSAQQALASEATRSAPGRDEWLRPSHLDPRAKAVVFVRGDERLDASLLSERARDRGELLSPPPFPLARTRNLYFHVLLRDVTGSHLARLELRAPGGTLYDVLKVPFEAGAGRRRAVRFAGGPVRPVEVQFARAGVSLLRGSLPVAGTLIEQYAMTGDWTVTLFLDERTEPLATASFTLR